MGSWGTGGSRVPFSQKSWESQGSHDWVPLFYHAAVASNVETCTFLNSFKRNMAKYIYVTFGSSEFLNIHIFNSYKALYSASSSTFRHLDFIRAIRWLRAASKIRRQVAMSYSKACSMFYSDIHSFLRKSWNVKY